MPEEANLIFTYLCYCVLCEFPFPIADDLRPVYILNCSNIFPKYLKMLTVFHRYFSSCIQTILIINIYLLYKFRSLYYFLFWISITLLIIHSSLLFLSVFFLIVFQKIFHSMVFIYVLRNSQRNFSRIYIHSFHMGILTFDRV